MAAAVAAAAGAPASAAGAAAPGEGDSSQGVDMESFYRQASYPLVKHTDMAAEVREEALDICITAVEKHAGDMEKCTQMIKDQMDRKFGSPWHVIVGRAFAYEITYELRNILYLFVGGTTGVLLWKM